MQIVASAPARMGLRDIGEWARRAERLGFDVLHISETIHDPFAVAALALAHTEHVTVRTSMALAFPRSPMVMAYSGWDLRQYSGGRFQLGVASQVRGNIVDRFSSAWSEPVSRLRDYINSLRVIFAAFQSGERLEYLGPHYQFTRLQPYFNPGPLECGPPEIWTGGVNTKMCMLAGEVSDGFVCHPTNSHPVVLTDHTLPSVAAGADRRSRPTALPAVVVNPQPLIGADDDELATIRDARRSELAFLYSTPAYRRQLDYFDLTDVGAALTDMASRSEWSGLSEVLDDAVLARLVPQGTYQDVGDVLAEWYSGLCSGLVLPIPADEDHDRALSALVERCKTIPTRHD